MKNSKKYKKTKHGHETYKNNSDFNKIWQGLKEKQISIMWDRPNGFKLMKIALQIKKIKK